MAREAGDRSDADRHGANVWFASLVAGYEHVVTAAEMKLALGAHLDAAVAAKLSAGVDLETARAAAAEAPLWKEYEAYAAGIVAHAPLLYTARAALRSDDATAALAQLDEARAKLRAEAKDKDAALRSPAFRELSGLARALAIVHGVRRPFE